MIKSQIKRFDNRFLGRFIQNFYEFCLALHYSQQNNRDYKKLKKSLGYRIEINYDKRSSDTLSSLCDLHGSDKGEIDTKGHPYTWKSHTYSDYYSGLFSHCRSSILKVFECGVGTNNTHFQSSMGDAGLPGASLRVWRDFFPNARVYGADIDEEILFQEERIDTFFVDQTDVASIKELWNNLRVKDFDVMIDDGLHTFKAGSTLFENSIDRLASHGIYIIEDVAPKDILKYKQYFHAKNYVVDYVYLFSKNQDIVDNNLVVIRKP